SFPVVTRLSAAVPAARKAARFLAEARHPASLDGRLNRRGSADPITHQCRELVAGSARLRLGRVVPSPSVGRVPLVQTIAASPFLHILKLFGTRARKKMFQLERRCSS